MHMFPFHSGFVMLKQTNNQTPIKHKNKETTRLLSYLLSYRSRLTVYSRSLNYTWSVKGWPGYELIDSQEMRSRQAPNQQHILIACSFPIFGFRWLQWGFSRAVPWYSCVSSSLQEQLLNASGYTTPDHQSGGHHNILDPWSEKAFTKGPLYFLYFMAIGDPWNYYDTWMWSI